MPIKLSKEQINYLDKMDFAPKRVSVVDLYKLTDEELKRHRSEVLQLCLLSYERLDSLC